MMAPYVLSGYVNGIFPVDPNPMLGFTSGGAELRPPTFPTITAIRTTIPADSSSLQFGETVSGRHYAYRGNFARIDDPAAHLGTIVDCDGGVSIVADTSARTYRVLGMDPTTIDQLGPPEPYIARLHPPAAAILSYASVDRAQLHSPLATIGYVTHYGFGLGIVGQPIPMFTEEQEFANGVPAAYPSCALHSFGGEPLGIIPRPPGEMPSPTEMRELYPPAIVSISGQPPAIPPNSLRVHVEYEVGTPLASVINITNVQTNSVPPEQFVAPAGFIEDATPRY
jgi:hypothetical protein